MPSFFIETFGCQMNSSDSDALADALASRGYRTALTSDDADVIVVNTCSVREHAEARAKARISQYCNRKKKNRSTQAIWVIGCMAQRLGKTLSSEIPGINVVVGAQEIPSFIRNIDEFITTSRAASAGGNIIKTSAFVPIMRGCDNFCSYCVVPFVRGRERSIPYAQIENTVRQLLLQGVLEVTLLGQNVNSYRDGPLDFSGLLEKIHALPGLRRIRFTTSHPKDCTRKLLSTIASLPKVCKHIHLPVQSGSSRVLGLMNRGYTREMYLQLIAAWRREIPDIDITTDAMVGFPSESTSDFQDTLSLFREVRFTAAFMFAYSKRERTAAAGFADEVPAAVKKERLAGLIALQTDITKERYGRMVGRELEVLFVEQQRGRKNVWVGRDTGCKRALLTCTENIAGTILMVRASRSSGMSLITERM